MSGSPALRVISVGLGVLSVVLIMVNAGLLWANQSVEAEVANRQRFINQTAQLSRVNNALARALGNSAENNKDSRLSELLVQQGITLAPDTSPDLPAAGASP